MIIQPDNVSKSQFEVFHGSTRLLLSMSRFLDNMPRSKFSQKWWMDYCSMPQMVFRITNMKRSFVLYGKIFVSFGGIHK